MNKFMAKKKNETVVAESKEMEQNYGESSVDGTSESELEELAEGKGGKTYLPGAEPVVVKALVEQVIEIEEVLKPEFASARDALMNGQTNLSKLAHENIQHFTPPDQDGKRVYEGGGVRVEITFEKEKIKGKVIDEDE